MTIILKTLVFFFLLLVCAIFEKLYFLFFSCSCYCLFMLLVPCLFLAMKYCTFAVQRMHMSAVKSAHAASLQQYRHGVNVHISSLELGKKAMLFYLILVATY